MLRERVSDNIYVFTSDIYAQVTAGAIVTEGGVILVDTLPFPTEARELKTFTAWVCRQGVRYVILTHYHADHTYGTYLFPSADVVAHARCRELLAEVGIPALEAAKLEEPDLQEVTLRLPDITFDDEEMGLQLGGKVIRIIHTPGHTRGSVMVHVEDNQVLFAADTIMPVPAIADGDADALRKSLRKVLELEVNTIVQGHGEVKLRGEVKSVIEIGLAYLDAIEEVVSEALDSGQKRDKLRENSIESCGLSRLPLNGLVQQIHVANLLSLYDKLASPEGAAAT